MNALIIAHYDGIMDVLETLIFFLSLAVIGCVGLWVYYKVDIWLMERRRRIRHRELRIPGAFKTRPYRDTQ